MPSRHRTALVLGAVVVAIVVSIVFRAVHGGSDSWWMYDMQVFRKAGQRVLDGDTVYWQTPRSLFTHTPFNALIFVPFAVIPLPVVAVVWNAVIVFCLQILTWLSIGAAGVRGTAVRAASAVGLSVVIPWFDPLLYELHLGQMNMVCNLLLFVDLVVLSGRRGQGVLTGLLTGVYLLPGLFVAFLLATRRYPAFLRAVTTFLATAVIGAVALPRDSLVYWSGTFLDRDRVGAVQNPNAQSLQDVVARFGHTTLPGWQSVPIVVLLCVAGVALAAMVHRRGDPLSATIICGLTVLVATPITWDHQYVWAIVPALTVLAAVAAQRRSAVLALVAVVSALNFVVAPFASVPDDARSALQLTVWQGFLTSTFLLDALVLAVVFTMLRLRDPAVPDHDPVIRRGSMTVS